MYAQRGLLNKPFTGRKIEHNPTDGDLQNQRSPHGTQADTLFID